MLSSTAESGPFQTYIPFEKNRLDTRSSNYKSLFPICKLVSPEPSGFCTGIEHPGSSLQPEPSSIDLICVLRGIVSVLG